MKIVAWTFCETSLFLFLVLSIPLSFSLWSKSPSMEKLCHIGFHECSYLRLLRVLSTVTGARRGPPRARRVWWRFCALVLTVGRFSGITIVFSVGSVCGGHGLWKKGLHGEVARRLRDERLGWEKVRPTGGSENRGRRHFWGRVKFYEVVHHGPLHALLWG